ncbi:MAG: hypothetical protein U9Q62_12265 [Campylobacterota bacterium]|nr:hypothetical protein [Campylobacterota bacterium]
MSSGLERLKKEGAQKIYETTHISRQNIEAIFNASYAGITKVQLDGFISILEREYKVDLSAVKADYLSCRETVEENKKTEAEPVEIFTNSPKQRRSLILAAAAFIVVIAALITFPGDDNTSAAIEVNESVAVEAVIIEELNATDENLTMDEEVVFTPSEPVFPEKLVIEPKAKLWMGYIDLKTLQRSQKLTSRSIDLDPKKGWLLVFGHGYFKIHIGDEVMDFSAKGKVRMIYEEGQVREIDSAEFKERNRGNNW